MHAMRETQPNVRQSVSSVKYNYSAAGGIFPNSVSGPFSGADQDIFTKFGVYVDNGVPQRAEWPNMLSSIIQNGGRRPS